MQHETLKCEHCGEEIRIDVLHTENSFDFIATNMDGVILANNLFDNLSGDILFSCLGCNKRVCANFSNGSGNDPEKPHIVEAYKRALKELQRKTAKCISEIGFERNNA